jgi:hypothetical protein
MRNHTALTGNSIEYSSADREYSSDLGDIIPDGLQRQEIMRHKRGKLDPHADDFCAIYESSFNAVPGFMARFALIRR